MKIIVLKFKTNTINIQGDMHIFSKYNLITHAQNKTSKFFQKSMDCLR